MKRCALLLAFFAISLPVFADCNPAVNSRGMLSSRGTVEMADNVCPMTVGEKGTLFLRHTWSPYNVFAAAGSAAIWQATQDRTQGYGQGWDAYGSRFGASLANRESQDFFKTFVFASALHMDPRYFRKGNGGFGARFFYAISRSLVGRTDHGRWTFNAPAILGSATSAGLSNAYLPDSDRTAGRTAVTFGLNIGADAGWNVLKEFGPEIRHLFHRDSQDSSANVKKDSTRYGNVPRP